LLSALDVFVQSGSDRGFLCGVTADPAGFVDQVVIDCQIRRHGFASL
jgi:hypothetical protein